MKEKAKGELVYKSLLDLEEKPLSFIPQCYKSQLTPHDDSITIIVEQLPITIDTERLKIPSVNILLIDEYGNQKILAEKISNVKTITPSFIVPDWDYEIYLKSEEWANRRRAYFHKHGTKCCVCNKEHSVQLHHLNYIRLGYEKDSDLICLCAECHNLLHIYKDQYLERIGDLPRMWYYPTRNIENANTCGDLINRFIAKYKPQLDYVFDGLPPISGYSKAKFTSELLSSMRSRNENKLLPYHIIVKLIKSK